MTNFLKEGYYIFVKKTNPNSTKKSTNMIKITIRTCEKYDIYNKPLDIKYSTFFKIKPNISSIYFLNNQLIKKNLLITINHQNNLSTIHASFLDNSNFIEALNNLDSEYNILYFRTWIELREAGLIPNYSIIAKQPLKIDLLKEYSKHILNKIKNE